MREIVRPAQLLWTNHNFLSFCSLRVLGRLDIMAAWDEVEQQQWESKDWTAITDVMVKCLVDIYD